MTKPPDFSACALWPRRATAFFSFVQKHRQAVETQLLQERNIQMGQSSTETMQAMQQQYARLLRARRARRARRASRERAMRR